MKSSIVRIILAVAAVVAAYVPASAQAAVAPYKFDFGAALGMSGYIGDANSGNPFRHPGFTGDLRFGYILDTRWALRGWLGMQGLSGNTADINNVLPSMDAHRSFTSTVFDLGVRGEYNFLPYGIGETYKRLRRVSPYLALGIGVALSSADGSTAAGFTVPMAVGVRYKAKPRLNVFAEFSMTKVFNDHMDGRDIADLNHIKTDFYKSTDWFSRIAIGISYEFGKRCETCHYVD